MNRNFSAWFYSLVCVSSILLPGLPQALAADKKVIKTTL